MGMGNTQKIAKNFFILFILLFTPILWAAASGEENSEEVWFGNELLFRTPSETVKQEVSRRLELAILSGISPSQILVRGKGKLFTLYAGKIPVVTVTQARARVDKTDPHSLALLWAARVRKMLTEGHYLVAPGHLAIPVGEIRTLEVKGKFSEPLSVNVLNRNVCEVVSNNGNPTFQGLHPGQTMVVLSYGSMARVVGITVQDFAGSIPKAVSLTLTGNEISSAFLQQAVLDAVRAAIFQREGTKMSTAIPPGIFPENLASGASFNLNVPAQVSGLGYLPIKRNLSIDVAVKSFTLPSCAHLLLSNNPENFNRAGILFREAIPQGLPARLFFHHHNNGKAPYRYVLELVNQFNNNADIHVLQGIAGPSKDELFVGRMAAKQFLSVFRDKVGRVVEVSPDSAYPLISLPVGPGQTVSGILQLTPMNQERPLVVSKVVSSKFSDLWNPEQTEMLGLESGKSSGTFPEPDVTVHVSYEAGGAYAFIPIGRAPVLRSLQTNQVDSGNYGVLYTVILELKNPLAMPQNTVVMFSPQAGPAGGVFLINGKDLLTTPIVPAFTPYPIMTMALNSGETRTITIQTIPEGGSFYPIHLIVEPECHPQTGPCR